MKTRNIFAAFAFGLFAAVTLTTVGCTDNTTPGKEIPGKEIHDTIKTTDTLGRFNISKITAEAANYRMEVEFTPDDDWTFSSTAPWLTVISERGTKTDRVLVFDVAENTDPVARVANTILSVGGVKYPLTINQKAAMPVISIYGTVTNFNDDNTAIRISNIASNLDLEIVSIPTWVVGASVVKVEDGLYVIDAKLRGFDRDDEVREGEIVIKDKNSDVSATIAIVCDPANSGFYLDAHDNFKTPFVGLSANSADFTRMITIKQKPGADILADPYVPVARVVTNGVATDAAADYVTIERAAPGGGTVAHAAYTAQDWNLSVVNYASNSDRVTAIFVVRESEKETFTVADHTPSMLFTQSGGKPFEITGQSIVTGNLDFSASVSEAKFGVVVFDACTDIEFSFTGGTENNDDPSLDTRFKGTITEVSKAPSSTKGEGWSDYIYTISSTRAQSDQIGWPGAKAADLSGITYTANISATLGGKPAGTLSVAKVKFINSSSVKLKNTTDKFNFSTWNAAGIAADNQLTVLVRNLATDALKITVSYSSGLDTYVEGKVESLEATDTDNDGYKEVVVSVKTKVAISNPTTIFSPFIYLWHEPVNSYNYTHGRIPVTFEAAP